jgi:hypothetical protein
MGGMAMSKCKGKQINYFHTQTNCKHFQGGYGGLQFLLAMFTHAMNFFKEHVSLKKSILEHFFTNLLNDLSTKDLVTLGNLLSIEFMKP